jgi:H/ACA ribonucleoprotein complex subunit 2
MAKDKSEKSSKERKEKKEKTRSAENGVKKEKKHNKERKEKVISDVAEKVAERLQENIESEEDIAMADVDATAPIIGALVPFANPLADEKQQKKILRTVKKGMSNVAIIDRWVSKS